MLILTLLQGGPLHGLQVAKQLGSLIEGGTPLSYGSVYPALHRLEQQQFIEGSEVASAEGARPIRQYQLTPAGRTELQRLQAAQRQFMQQLSALWGEV